VPAIDRVLRAQDILSIRKQLIRNGSHLLKNIDGEVQYGIQGSIPAFSREIID
jgi:hypothetical protein